MTVLADPHLALVRPVSPRTPDGCEECLRLGLGLGAPAAVPDLRARRLLRLLPAAARARATRSRSGTRSSASFEPGENWRWCYVNETYV